MKIFLRFLSILVCILFTATASNLYAQEICNNGLDDDGDGLTDCFDGDCAGDAACANAFTLQTDPSCPAMAPLSPGGSAISLVQKWQSSVSDIDERGFLAVADIDNDGVPEVVAMDPGASDLYYLEGTTGAVVNNTATGKSGNYEYHGFAIGDTDNDGFGELFFTTSNRYLHGYNHDMSQVFAPNTTSAERNYELRNHLGLADFNGDGNVEVYSGIQVWSAVSGNLIVDGGVDSRGKNPYFTSGGAASVAVDILPDSECTICDGPEIVAGNSIWAVDIATSSIVKVKSFSTYSDGTTSVADVDNDGDLDIVVSGREAAGGSTYSVYAWDGQTPTLLGAKMNTTASRPASRITVANIDADPELEYVYGHYRYLTVLDDDFSVLWEYDQGSNQNIPGGATFYDLNGDGSMEVIWQETFTTGDLMVFDALTGSVLGATPCGGNGNTTGTAALGVGQPPIIADIDNDDQVDIICDCHGDRVHVFESGGTPWVDGREVWHQHGYTLTSIDDDLGIPNVMSNPSARPYLNNFLIQSPPLTASTYTPALEAADMVVTALSGTALCGLSSNVNLQVDLTIQNNGGKTLYAPVPVAIYSGDPFTDPNAYLMSLIYTDADVASSGTLSLSDTITGGGSATFDMYAVVNDDGSFHVNIPFTDHSSVVAECDFSNNTLSALAVANCPEICDDGIDNDGDGLTDCYDTDCALMAVCSDENAGQATPACGFLPPADPPSGAFNIVEEWQSTTVAQEYEDFVIADLDNNGVVDILVPNYNTKGADIVNGVTGGGVTLTFGGSMSGNIERNGPAVADTDGDGLAEMFFTSQNRYLYGYNHDGSVIFENEVNADRVESDESYLGLADFNGDGIVELYSGNQIYTTASFGLFAAGDMLVSGGSANSAGFIPADGSRYAISIAADILPDYACADCAGMELVTGDVVWTVNLDLPVPTITPFVTSTDLQDGLTTVADVDLDGDLDVVVSTRAEAGGSTYGVYVWDGQTDNLIGSFINYNAGSGISPVTVFNADNDPEPEYFFGGYQRAQMVDNDFTEMWQHVQPNGSTTWASSGTAYDLDGNGSMEIIYVEPSAGDLNIFDASTGTVLGSISHPDGNSAHFAQPQIADVDGDGQAEILVNQSTADNLFCYGSGGTPWVTARPVWNQRNYQTTAIDNDLGIPQNQTEFWNYPVLNKTLSQTPPIDANFNPAIDVADLEITSLSGTPDCGIASNKNFVVTVTIMNNGTNTAYAPFIVSYYRDDPYSNANAFLISGTRIDTSLAPGVSYTYTDTISGGGQATFDFYAVVNDNGSFSTMLPYAEPASELPECDYSNNSASVTGASNCPEICGDGADNDGDGLTDCYDGDCFGDATCDPNVVTSAQPTPNCNGVAPASVASNDMVIAEDWFSSTSSLRGDESPIVGDFNQDGEYEVITGRHNTQEIFITEGDNGFTGIFPIAGTGNIDLTGAAMADVDASPSAELFYITSSRYMTAMNEDGSLKWQNTNTADRTTTALAFVGVADFNGDGNPEVYAEDKIFNSANGQLLLNGNGAEGYNPYITSAYSMSVAIDILPDYYCDECCGLELVAGNTIYTVDLDAAIPTMNAAVVMAGYSDGWASVADIDNDNDLDVVLSCRLASGGSTYRLVAFDGQDPNEILSEIVMPTASRPSGRPSLTNLDADPELEIVYSNYNGLKVLDHDFTELWNYSHANSDYPGSYTVFDLDGNSVPEIIYQEPFDAGFVRIFDGATGEEVAQYDCGDGDRMEAIIVADVDNDNEVEIVVTCDDGRIRALQGVQPLWVNARSEWNQHNYHTLNVNEDLSIPLNETKLQSAPATNTFPHQLPMLNADLDPVVAAADLTITINSFTRDCATLPRNMNFNITVTNTGDAEAKSQLPITIYSGGNPFTDSNAVYEETILTPLAIPAGSSITFSQNTLPFAGDTTDVYLVVNDNGSGDIPFVDPDAEILECDYSNNIASQSSVIPCPEICDDGFDNDGDGNGDCYDTDCSCGENGNTIHPSCENSFFGVCEPSCQMQNISSAFTMGSQWSTSGGGFSMDARQVPAIGDLDGDGIPEVMGRTGSRLIIFNGEDGTVQASTAFSQISYNDGSTIGDVDGDGTGEIFAMGSNFNLARFEHDLTQTWVQPNNTVVRATGTFGTAEMGCALADFDQDGTPEVYAGNQIFSTVTGAQICGMTNVDFMGHNLYDANGSYVYPVAADILPDNYCADCQGLELVAGGSIYAVNIATGAMYEAAAAPASIYYDGYTAIADMDVDGDMDVVYAYAAGGRKISVWDGQTDEEIGTYLISASNNNLSAPSVADFDGDGFPEILICTVSNLRAIEDVVNGGGVFTTKWSVSTNDASGFTTSSVFDFNGDGLFEIVYRDQSNLRVINGNTGANIQTFSCSSPTRTEYPVVADVDADGETEIVCGCGNNIQAFKSTAGPWITSRKVHNQFSYHVTNVNDDLTIPTVMQDHTQTNGLNSFLSQATQLLASGQPALPAADGIVNVLTINTSTCQDGTNNTVDIVYRVDNQGSAPISFGTPVTVYDMDPTVNAGASVLGTDNIPLTVEPGDFYLGSITVSDGGGTIDYAIIFNDDGSLTPTFDLATDFPVTGLGECDYENNMTIASLIACNYCSADLAGAMTNPVSPQTCVPGNDGYIEIMGAPLVPSTAYNVSYSIGGVPTGPFAMVTDAGGNLTVHSLTAGVYTDIIVSEISDPTCNDTLPGPWTLTAASNPSLTAADIVSNDATCGVNDGSIVVNGLIPTHVYNVTYTKDAGAPVTVNGFVVAADSTLTIDTLLAGSYTNISLDNQTSNCGAFTLPGDPHVVDENCNCIVIAGTSNLTSCNALTNTYQVDVEVSYLAAGATGFVINGQSFTYTSSPQTVTLTFPADGQVIDLIGYDVDDQLSCRDTLASAYTAPAACNPSVCHMEITGYGLASATPCDPATNTYMVTMQMNYQNQGTSGFVINGQAFAYTGSPQDVTLTLPADGMPVSFSAYDVDDPSCNDDFNDAFVAPSSCSVPPLCGIEITGLGPAGVTACDPATNTYDVDVQVNYVDEGSNGFTINGQTFAYATSPQIVTLTFPADGSSVNLVGYDNDNPTTCIDTFANAYTAPVSCSSECAISVTGAGPIGVGPCNPATNTYTALIQVNHSNSGGSGFTLNGQTFSYGASPQTVSLTLTADGNPVTLTAVDIDSAAAGCTDIWPNAFMAPVSCSAATCEFVVDSANNVSACNTGSNSYTVDVFVTYDAQGSSGFVINGQAFAYTTSPQMVTLNLPADGQPVDLIGYDADNFGTCLDTLANAYTAPSSCAPSTVCDFEITGYGQIGVGPCDSSSNTYMADVQVNYLDEGSNGFTINGQTFAYSTSPQTVTLTLTADGSSVDLIGFDVDNMAMCRDTFVGAFVSPAPCAVNQPPVPTDTSLINTPIVYDTTDINTNVTTCLSYTDANGDNIDITGICNGDGADNGLVAGMGDGDTCMTYIPDPGFVGMDTMCVLVCDDGAPVACDTITYIVTVEGAGPVEDCSNGIDDDGDGLIDCQDPDCSMNCANCPAFCVGGVSPCTPNGSGAYEQFMSAEVIYNPRGGTQTSNFTPPAGADVARVWAYGVRGTLTAIHAEHDQRANIFVDLNNQTSSGYWNYYFSQTNNFDNYAWNEVPFGATGLMASSIGMTSNGINDVVINGTGSSFNITESAAVDADYNTVYFVEYYDTDVSAIKIGAASGVRDISTTESFVLIPSGAQYVQITSHSPYSFGGGINTEIDKRAFERMVIDLELEEANGLFHNAYDRSAPRTSVYGYVGHSITSGSVSASAVGDTDGDIFTQDYNEFSISGDTLFITKNDQGVNDYIDRFEDFYLAEFFIKSDSGLQVANTSSATFIEAPSAAPVTTTVAIPQGTIGVDIIGSGSTNNGFVAGTNQNIISNYINVDIENDVYSGNYVSVNNNTSYGAGSYFNVPIGTDPATHSSFIGSSGTSSATNDLPQVEISGSSLTITYLNPTNASGMDIINSYRFITAPIDVEITDITLDLDCNIDTSLYVTICNSGIGTLSSGVPISVYDADPTASSANLLLTVLSTKAVNSGQCEIDTLDLSSISTSASVLYVVANDSGVLTPVFSLTDLASEPSSVDECDFGNNMSSVAFGNCGNQAPTPVDTNLVNNPVIYDTTDIGTNVTTCLSYTDPDGDNIDITGICNGDGADNGLVAGMGDGDTCLTYIPDPGFVGMDTMCVLVCDDGSPAACDTITYIVTVNDTVNNICFTPFVFLEGAYDAAGDSMRTLLRNCTGGPSGFLPLSQPYNMVPWNYAGTESAASLPTNMVDWVLVTVREQNDAGAIIFREAGLLLSDGSIVDVSGDNEFCAEFTAGDSMYVVIQHRNHVTIQQQIPITTYTPTVLNMDFRGMQSFVEFGSAGQKQIGPRFVMYAGDGGKTSGNGDINGGDFTSTTQNIPLTGYYIGDTDLNCDCNGGDFTNTSTNIPLSTAVPTE